MLCAHSAQYPFVDLNQFEHFVLYSGFADDENLRFNGAVDLFRIVGNGKHLNRPKFVDLLLRLIRKKYDKHEKHVDPNFNQYIEDFIERYLVPFAYTLNWREFREQVCWHPKVNSILLERQTVLRMVFHQYQKIHDMKQYFNVNNGLQLIRDAQLEIVFIKGQTSNFSIT